MSVGLLEVLLDPGQERGARKWGGGGRGEVRRMQWREGVERGREEGTRSV